MTQRSLMGVAVLLLALATLLQACAGNSADVRVDDGVTLTNTDPLHVRDLDYQVLDSKARLTGTLHRPGGRRIHGPALSGHHLDITVRDARGSVADERRVGLGVNQRKFAVAIDADPATIAAIDVRYHQSYRRD